MREFILNRLNMIYYIYIFVELTITLNLLTMKEFTFLFFFSVLLIVMFFQQFLSSQKILVSLRFITIF